MLGYFLAGVAGAVVAYFLDPDRGRRRRNVTRDRFFAVLRRQSRSASRLSRRATRTLHGVTQEAAHAPEIREALDDATLARKVESEVFRDRGIARGGINVNVEEGVVVLRGQVDRPEDLLMIEDTVRRLPDVVDVRNLLHMPGEPSPNKADAIASERPPSAAVKANPQPLEPAGTGGEATLSSTRVANPGEVAHSPAPPTVRGEAKASEVPERANPAA